MGICHTDWSQGYCAICGDRLPKAQRILDNIMQDVEDPEDLLSVDGSRSEALRKAVTLIEEAGAIHMAEEQAYRELSKGAR